MPAKLYSTCRSGTSLCNKAYPGPWQSTGCENGALILIRDRSERARRTPFTFEGRTAQQYFGRYPSYSEPESMTLPVLALY